MPRYCQRCILPDTRPEVLLDGEGVCRACRNAERKAGLDWPGRARAFREVVAAARARARTYDCIVPVSGGKDSYWQVVTCLEHGLHPLLVTYVCPGQSALGQRNLQGLIQLGADHVEFRTNPLVERAFVRKAFEKLAMSGLVFNMGVFAFPVRLALALEIPLVVYGENSAFEYGSEEEGLEGARMDRRWLRRFGVNAGTTAEDWIDEGVLTRQALRPFLLPDEALLEEKQIHVVFLGHYFPWDPQNSYKVARAHGFEARAAGPRVGHYDFANVDDDMIGVHHHPKWHKFGITRSWDTLSMEIRAGRLSRDQAIDLLRRRGDETPWDDIRVFCDYVGITRAEYLATLERFRNREIWTRRAGRWVIEDFLVPDFPWPEDPASSGRGAAGGQSSV